MDETGMSGQKANGYPILKGRPRKGNYLVRGDDVVHCLYRRTFIRRKGRPNPRVRHVMKIELKKITVRDLVEDYHDDGEGGVRGYGGKLDIRPPFQREFVYKDKQRDAVIETINKGFPLNVMYWAVRQDGTYEVIDGQQRTISAAQYVEGDYSLDGRYFHNLQDDEQERILNYPLQVYVCEGNASEKLDWFRIINIAGEKLTDQELRNAVYAGPWVSDAKRHFSRPNSPAYAVGNKYVQGSPIRQDYLETAIQWIRARAQTVEDYMAAHQHDRTATALWSHFPVGNRPGGRGFPELPQANERRGLGRALRAP